MSTDNSNNPYAAPTVPTEPPLTEMDEQDYVLASLSSRFIAALIDGIISFAAAIPGIFVLSKASNHDDFSIVGWAFILFGELAVSIYQWYLISLQGQTIGKKRLSIKIARINGSPLTFLHGVVLRSWVIGLLVNIPIVGPIIGVVNVFMIFGSQRRCLHDHFAGTRVIDAPANMY